MSILCLLWGGGGGGVHIVFLSVEGVVMSFSVIVLTAGKKRQAVTVMPQPCGASGRPAEKGGVKWDSHLGAANGDI